MAIFYLKRRDTRPTMEVYLIGPSGAAHDLSGAVSATLHVHQKDGTTITRTMTIDGTPATGIIRYTWLAADWTGTPALVKGTHRMEYEVVGPTTARMTFPNADYDILSVLDDLGQA